jgi:hypothetical protein
MDISAQDSIRHAILDAYDDVEKGRLKQAEVL